MDKDVFVHGQESGRMSHKYRKIDQKDQTKAQTLPFKVAFESQSVGMVPALV